VNVTRYRAEGRRYLAVDAANYVPDRTGFAARHCDPDTGVRPPGAVAPDDGSPRDDRSHSPAGRPGFDGRGPVATKVAARSNGGRRNSDGRNGGGQSGGGEALNSTHGARGTNGVRGTTDVESVRGADAVLFLALEAEYRPPRVVLTVIREDGIRVPYSSPAVKCAARWAATELGEDRVMVDTQAGTNEVRVGDVGAVVVEPDDLDGPSPTSGRDRGTVVREFVTAVSREP
jgi:hypothetical protein